MVGPVREDTGRGGMIDERRVRLQPITEAGLSAIGQRAAAASVCLSERPPSRSNRIAEFAGNPWQPERPGETDECPTAS